MSPTHVSKEVAGLLVGKVPVNSKTFTRDTGVYCLCLSAGNQSP